MYINDRALNDTNFHNGSTITEKDSESYTNGTFVANQSNGTAKYVFSRTPNKDYYFSLTPEKEGVYKFTGASYLQVTYEKGILMFKKTVTVNPEPDGTYLLSKGITYTIKMRTSSGEFSVQQDNWVYAPNGGTWTVVPFNHYYPMERMYIPDHTLIEAIYLTSDRAAEINADASVESQTKTVMTLLGITEEKKSAVEALASIVAAIKGGSLTLAALLDPEPLTKTILGALVLDGVATYFLVSDISAMFNFFEANDFKNACKKGNLNLIFTRWGYASAINNLWDPWKTSCYINKYNYDSWNGYVRGTITLNDSVQDVIDYCRF